MTVVQCKEKRVCQLQCSLLSVMCIISSPYKLEIDVYIKFKMMILCHIVSRAIVEMFQ